MSCARLAVAVVLALSLPAAAGVGSITVLDGAGTRTPKGQAAIPLAVGMAIELDDTLTITRGNAKLTLTDGSVIALAPASVLVITRADFEGVERKGFSGFLKAGSLWTEVKKALGGARFEVTTERAVAGVRGTIFRIDADTVVKAAGGGSRRASVVRVIEGAVRVRPTRAIAATFKTATLPKGPRTEVSGPQEISADEWESRFVELTAGAQIAVGVDLWEQAQVEQKARDDAFQKWLDAHP